MKRGVLYIVFLLISSIQLCTAQDVQFSQFYASPMYLNPALAGTADQHRVVANFRDQWPSIPGAFVSYALSYDVNLSDAHSGIGLFVNRDQAGSGGLSTTNIGGVYAYDLKINRKLAVRPAIGITYGLRQLDVTKLQFGDQLLTGNDISVQSNLVSDSKGYMDLSAGGVLYGTDFWAGYSIFHINSPNNSLLGIENTIDARHSIHLGYRLPMQRTVKRQIVRSLTVAANYKAQGQWDQFDIGMYFYTKPFVMGVWYRGIPGLKAYKKGYQNNDAVVLLAGAHYKSFKFAYSYDITVSKIWSNTGGAHEISLIYEYINPRKKKKSRRVKLACPKF